MTQKQVRRSKKELAHERSELALITRRKHKKETKKRTTQLRDFDEIFDKHGLPDAPDLTAFIDALISENREGRGPPEDHDLLIFDPKIDDLIKLPIGVLDHKELPLPNKLIPQSSEELLAHCERMIVRNRKRDVIAYVVAGWPGCGANRNEIKDSEPTSINEAHQCLGQHVSALWQLSQAWPDLYGAIVCGRHRSALRLMEAPTRAGAMSKNAILQLIQQHGLLWCTNDLQTILARSALGARNLFGLLASTTHIEMKPERVANDSKPHLMLLRLALDLYATTAEENRTNNAKPPGTMPDDDLAQLLERRLKRSAERSGLDLLALRPKLDKLISLIRSLRTYGAEAWWQELAKPVTANELSAHFSGMWFSARSSVQAAAITVLRYLQAEVWIERLVAERMPDVRSAPPRHHTAMPQFDAEEFDAGFLERAKDLLFLYRRETLRDKIAPKADATLSYRAKNAGAEPIKAGLNFLAEAGMRAIGDDHGDPTSVSRTFYLLDVLPESRLSR